MEESKEEINEDVCRSVMKTGKIPKIEMGVIVRGRTVMKRELDQI